MTTTTTTTTTAAAVVRSSRPRLIESWASTDRLPPSPASLANLRTVPTRPSASPASSATRPSSETPMDSNESRKVRFSRASWANFISTLKVGFLKLSLFVPLPFVPVVERQPKVRFLNFYNGLQISGVSFVQ